MPLHASRSPRLAGNWSRPCIGCGRTPAQGAEFYTTTQETGKGFGSYRASRCKGCTGTRTTLSHSDPAGVGPPRKGDWARPCLGCGRTPRQGAEFYSNLQETNQGTGRYRKPRCRDCSRPDGRSTPIGYDGAGRPKMGDWTRPCVGCGLTPADGAHFGQKAQETKKDWRIYRMARCSDCMGLGHRVSSPRRPKPPEHRLGRRLLKRAEKAGGEAWARVRYLDACEKELASGRSVGPKARLWLSGAEWCLLTRPAFRKLTRPRAGEWDT
jgi:hypothetical protein